MHTQKEEERKRKVIESFGALFLLHPVLGSKDLGIYVFRTLMCIVGKPWSKQCV